MFVKNNRNNLKRILFIEPTKQGFGDLFFQTSLFKALKESGYEVFVLTNKNHSQILEHNQDITGLFFWNMKGLSTILLQNYCVVGLGRSTFIETFALVFSKNKIVLDNNINNWIEIFKHNPNTIAWIKIFESLILTSLDNPLPHIQFSPSELNWIKNNKTDLKVGVIFGVSDITKTFSKINQLIENIPINYEVVLLGIKSVYSGKRKLKNLTNLTYRKTLAEMATCSHIIGTEGSLVHNASTFNLNLIVIDEKDEFRKNTHPDLLRNVKIFNKGDIVENLVNFL